MINIFNKIEKLLSANPLSKASNLMEEEGAKEYFGVNFQVDQLNFKFRNAKITPKKVGLFLTLWRRNSENRTEPFKKSDNFDFYIVAVEENENHGFFLFPKNELAKRQILTTNLKEGKRGFRVYPNWIKTESRQAVNTQIWQSVYFVDLANANYDNTVRIKEILANR